MIAVGDALPNLEVTINNEKHHLADFARGKTLVLFGVPAAYSPTCSEAHLPGFVREAAALRAKGVDAIVCHSVNDHYVMKAWGKSQGVEDQVLMLADWDAALTRALGTELDASKGGLGLRSHRYALIARDGRVSFVAREDSPPQHGVSSAESVLKQL